MNLAQQKLSHPQSSQQQPLLLSTSHGVLGGSSVHTPTDLTLTGQSLPPNTTPHVARQLTYAQISRQSSSPHHHARTAAAMARNAPVASTVTITDPNNPANKIVNGVRGCKKKEETEAQTWTTLDIGGMGLKNLSPALCSYTFLTVIYMNHNNLTYLAPSIAKLENLKVLDASGNKLMSLPPEIGLLVNLKELLLFDNHLTTLPSEMGTLYQLETLGLEGNPMQADIKNLLLKEGTQAVIMSLRESAPVGMPPPHREWITIEGIDAADEEKQDKFTVLCYNILCQKYATSQAYGYTPSWALNWDYRQELLIAELQGWNADIFCLQEVEMGRFEDTLQHHFKEEGDYDSIFYPKSRAKTMSEKERRVVDGCATFYRASKFNIIEHYLLEYNQKALQRPDFKKTEDIYNRVMNKDNIAILTMLENKQTLERVLVANSHVHWDPSFADVKLVQVGMLMDEIEKFAMKHLSPPASSPNGRVYASPAALPTVVCGDFNSVPESGVYEFLSKSAVEQGHCDFGDHIYGNYTSEGLSHPLSLKSAYSHIGELPFTNYTPGYKGVLDYIWYTNNTLDVLSLLGPIEESYLTRVVGFPNPHFPSDHIPIMTELRFRPSQREAEEADFGFSSRRYNNNNNRSKGNESIGRPK
ncbi:Endonuclease/exonuclease/phosphatase [Radiomyces spectabilis]|uniref:Endonuclease/exonuclease/phosphatase n=1 Tax=Radiomyces spectabilis TaxID=64574 RepID=UPI0022212530|nr:Endonuclease/exonuclease/phosphatase [Radiomyces spectabilis]KAI8374608.1 Endonuclease/exonuclease/phosphatase [Radiomyces spectabilis]